ncbi:cellulose synthase/poly-beta-1,6-N-acetylglucosamine synthase-like glycosyltransferase [Arcticibacter tournemirensis]|uniref:Glycosyltransferase n=1 Tax=Arcticibacter tournemirensis TaxID=699437 RepID=A0A5M9HBL4_9SPHI|nr:glycosyltransferase [Arcticibacter tournemirensis]KAA8483779.1 glycosyltransferase [Arcticibacter tournemirensis]TQM50019.1 cellulose synthase/poly-beta-1,6-N-acetylglucosamine synthase-like glycosyltransferase [Arcticibacter tournemirensis]
MFFSIIIPLYNRPQEVDELLYTLTLQTYTRFEVLVIEDGSKLDAREIVESYKDKLDIHYFYKKNEGQGFTRNFAFGHAKGDYFIMFDSDCLIPVDYLEEVSRYLLQHHLDAYGGPDAAHTSFTPIQKAISYSMTSPFTTGGIRGNNKNLGGQYHPRSFNMGISRKVWEATGGFILTRLGEDIEFSIRIHSMGFKIGLIPNAVVYHKRRTDFLQFYRQIHFFGRARINIYKYFPSTLKLVHFFPALFTIFLIFTLLMNALNTQLAGICNLFLALFILMIFFHSWSVNKSARVAFLSIIAAFIQLTAYGLGFMQDFWKRIILKRS